jgi:protoporphyrinogen/coproporphyrinogen III oxidase
MTTERGLNERRAGTAGGTRQHVVIVGGGISGLSAAWHLQNRPLHDQDRIDVTVLESSNRWGGKVLTEHVDGPGDTPFVIEAGPDSFLTQKPWALQLARELGLDKRLLPTNEVAPAVFVLRHGKPCPLPDGLSLTVPTKPLSFMLSPLMSPVGRLRVLMELFVPAKRDDADETLASFIHRRFGQEALDVLAEPVLAGIYSADAEKLSLLATFPRFRQLEREHRSLIRALRANPARQRDSAQGDTPRLSQFVTLHGGVQELADALVSRLSADLRLRTSVRAIERADDGRYRVVLDRGEALIADAVLLTIPAAPAARLLSPVAAMPAAKLAALRSVSTGTISLAFRADDISSPLQGFGLVIPKSEHRSINAITITSSKFRYRAPADHVLLRAFFGGSRRPEQMTFDDQRLVLAVRHELRTLLGIKADPLFYRIYRWHNANPQYDLNHLETVATIEAGLPVGIFISGSAYRGVGLPDCVHQARQASDRILERLHRPTEAHQRVPHEYQPLGSVV